MIEASGFPNLLFEVVHLIPNTDRLFYHGSSAKLHLDGDRWLDPKFAKGRDEGDPERPHVFVTPDKLMAMAFVIKSDNVAAITMCRGRLTIVFVTPPDVSVGGWVYTCSEDAVYPFEEVVTRGVRTNKWVAYRRVEVVEREHIPGLTGLLTMTSADAYTLSESVVRERWTREFNDAAYSDQLVAFYQELLRGGSMRPLAAEACRTTRGSRSSTQLACGTGF